MTMTKAILTTVLISMAATVSQAADRTLLSCATNTNSIEITVNEKNDVTIKETSTGSAKELNGQTSKSITLKDTLQASATGAVVMIRTSEQASVQATIAVRLDTVSENPAGNTLVDITTDHPDAKEALTKALGHEVDTPMYMRAACTIAND